MNKIIVTGTMAGIALSNSISAAEKPNIIFILADDMGIGDVSGLNPGSKINTPNIDKMIKDGMTFTDAHTSSSVCTPSRYGIMTGRYCWRSPIKERVLSGYSPSLIPTERETVASMLKKHGYDTAMIGKWHLGITWQKKDGTTIKDYRISSKDAEEEIDFTKPILIGPHNLGFDYFFGISASWDMPPYAYIENDKLKYTKLVEHTGSIVPVPEEVKKAEEQGINGAALKKIKDKYPKQAWRAGLKDVSVTPTDPLPRFAKLADEYIQKHTDSKPFFLYLPIVAPHTPVVPNKQFVGKSKAGVYGDYVAEVDWFVGQIRDALKKKGIYKNTILIFSADNGYSIKAFPNAMVEKYNHHPSYIYAGCKARLTEGGHRVPFIVDWPAVVNPGTKCDDLVSLMDFYATCAELVGAKIPDNVAEDSFSFFPELEGKGQSNRDSIVHQDFSGYLGIRKGDWKLMLQRNNKIVLLNIKKDLREKINLIKSNPEKANELKSLLTKIIQDGRSTPGKPQKNDPSFSKKWEQAYWMENSN